MEVELLELVPLEEGAAAPLDPAGVDATTAAVLPAVAAFPVEAAAGGGLLTHSCCLRSKRKGRTDWIRHRRCRRGS